MQKIFVFAGLAAVAAAELGGVLLCTGANQTGICQYKVVPFEECIQVPQIFYTNTRTFAPDGEEFYCYPRVTNCGDPCNLPTGCTSGYVDFAYQHKYNLTAVGWDRLVRSFDCHAGKAVYNSTTPGAPQS
ncbi:hypothetical protein VHEMI09193 [[Torrubiella] hemipterigena]|uniref:Uncharacterized protein n=1 Tax=[Torrubiella] hemipterigena TaxID=1531966 RepID=A0A0A1TPL2_9HYPO|nr:hypothetical protein VHEMI09193 [[Torrubiella] hemipterigena]